jgi:hypothetical protein
MKILKQEAIYVWRHIHLNKSRLLIFFILLLLGFMLFMMNKFPYASVGLILIPLAYFLGVYTYQKYLMWEVGSISSDIVTKELQKLPDSYTLISGVVIPPNRGDTDHIVIGPNGIFVIETKHYGGEITCNGDEWKRHKVGRKGRNYKLWIGSPSNQVKRNAKVLKDFLLAHKEEIFESGEAPHIWIESILLFTNERANLYVKNPTVQILSLDEVCDFIKSQESEYFFSEEEIMNMSKVILEYSR